MTRAHRVNRLMVPLLFVVLFLAAAVATADTGAGLTAPAGPATVSVSADGPTRHDPCRKLVPDDSQIFAIAAHLCQPGAGITNTSAFGFQGEFCPNFPVGDGDVETSAQLPPGTRAADLQFRVGSGGVAWADELGYAHQLTCGAGSPCDLVVQLQVPGDDVYAAFTVVYGPTSLFEEPPPPAPAAPAAPDPAAPPAAAADPAAQPTTAPAGGKGAGGKAGDGCQDESAAKDSTAEPGSTTTSTTTTTTPQANCADSAGAAGEGGGTGDGGASSDREIAAARPSSAIVSEGVSRGVRVFASGVAGLVGGALIVLIVVRARRKMQLAGTW